MNENTISFSITRTFPVEAMYQAMSTCASLHPDEGFTGEEEETNGDIDEEAYYTNNLNQDQLNENQMAALRHLESVFQGEIPDPNGVDNSKFDDATDNNNPE
jgi:nucleotide-sensitive chloride channel 1A